jgi:hypothetical protein
VWPAGFRVSFSPTLGLIDDKGELVARVGDLVGLPDVDLNSAAGTSDDPYVAHGRVFDGCYRYVE